MEASELFVLRKDCTLKHTPAVIIPKPVNMISRTVVIMFAARSFFLGNKNFIAEPPKVLNFKQKNNH